MDSKITFTLHADGKSTEKTIVYNQLLAIGYAGRNIAKTMEHIKELEEQLGVPAPKKIPTIFQMSNMLLTQDPDIDFVGGDTCGEVEYIIITDGDEIYIGLGSVLVTENGGSLSLRSRSSRNTAGIVSIRPATPR